MQGISPSFRTMTCTHTHTHMHTHVHTHEHPFMPPHALLPPHTHHTHRQTHTHRNTHTHTHTHTHNENRETRTEQGKAVERKLLRNCRAVLDVFRSVGECTMCSTGHLRHLVPCTLICPHLSAAPPTTSTNPWRSSCPIAVYPCKHFRTGPVLGAPTHTTHTHTHTHTRVPRVPMGNQLPPPHPKGRLWYYHFQGRRGAPDPHFTGGGASKRCGTPILLSGQPELSRGGGGHGCRHGSGYHRDAWQQDRGQGRCWGEAGTHWSRGGGGGGRGVWRGGV